MSPSHLIFPSPLTPLQAPPPLPPSGEERLLLTSSSDHTVCMWALDASGRPSLAATLGHLPWTLSEPESYTAVTPMRAGRAGGRGGAGGEGEGVGAGAREGAEGLHEVVDAEHGIRGGVGGGAGGKECAAEADGDWVVGEGGCGAAKSPFDDPTGLAAFMESVEMGGEEGGEGIEGGRGARGGEGGEGDEGSDAGEGQGGGSGLGLPSGARQLRTKALIDSILERGRDSRAGGGGSGGSSGASMLGGRGTLSHNPVMHRLKVHRLAEVPPRTPR
jgi:hypothetical protein